MIINEVSYAEKLLKTGFSKRKSHDLTIIAKYCAHHLQMSQDQTKKFLIDYCREHLNGFNEVINRGLINRALQTSKKYNLRLPLETIITLSEISAIQRVDNKDYRKILFIMLAWGKQYKYNNTRVSSKKDHFLMGLYCYNDFQTVVKGAGLKFSKKQINHALNFLYQAGYFNLTRKGYLEIKFADENSYPAFVVKNFDDILLDYLKYTGENVISCKQCGNLFLKRSNREILCRKCYKEYRQQMNTIYQKRTLNQQLEKIE